MCNHCTMHESSGVPEVQRDEVVEAVLAASRAIVALAVRSLSAVSEDVTLTQYRALVVLASRGPQTVAALAEELQVQASTASRLCDRLVRDRLITRSEDEHDRRRVQLVLTTAGRKLLDDVSTGRRAEIAKVLELVPQDVQESLVAGLHQFAQAAGEVPEQDWSAGWQI
jgi:DNA-binding MarR family transcriptional regulator